MPTCPDCGSIIMEGNLYCSHCGAHLVWNEDETRIPDYESRISQDEMDILNDLYNTYIFDVFDWKIIRERLEKLNEIVKFAN